MGRLPHHPQSYFGMVDQLLQQPNYLRVLPVVCSQVANFESVCRIDSSRPLGFHFSWVVFPLFIGGFFGNRKCLLWHLLLWSVKLEGVVCILGSPPIVPMYSFWHIFWLVCMGNAHGFWVAAGYLARRNGWGDCIDLALTSHYFKCWIFFLELRVTPPTHSIFLPNS